VSTPAGRLRRKGAETKAAETSAPSPNGSSEPSASTPKAAPRGPSGFTAWAFEHWRTLTALGLLVLGAVLVMLGWYGTAYTNIFTEQIPYLISGGLLGLGLIVVAGFLAVSSIQAREIRELRRDLLRVLEALPAGGGGTGGGRAKGEGRVYVVPGGRSFHQPGCPILEGKDSEELAPAGAADAGYVACKLCGPD
jgi:hypothetical protein